jgi:putative hydrolase of the HAD superfamily
VAPPSESPRPLRAVTFDAAGTLIVPAEPVAHTYARLAARAGLVVDRATIGAAFARAVADAPPLAFGHPPPPRVAALERAWWADVVARALGVPGGSPAFAACFDALYDHYAHAAAWTVVPAARAVLTTLRGRGFAVGVISNFDGRLPGLLAELRLTPMLDTAVTSVDAGYAKPAPEIFHRAFRALGTPAAAVLHVGDDPHADGDGALGAGARAALVGPRRAVPGTTRLTRLAQVPALVARLSRSAR